MRYCKHGCGRLSAKNRKSCYKCEHEKRKKDDLAKYTFGVLRRNAKRRGIAFSLTLEEFRLFCVKTSYLNGKDRSVEGLSVDRIDPSKGYHKDNIQVLTLGDNVRKYHRRIVYDDRSGSLKTVHDFPYRSENKDYGDDVPF